MKIKISITLFVYFYCINIFAQTLPGSYSFEKKSGLAKINEAASSNPSSNSITDILIVQNAIWVGSGKGVSLSTDNGQTWTNFYGRPEFGTNSEGALAYNKYDGKIWASLAYNTNKNGEDVQTGGGLVYTSDNGSTWKTIRQPVDAEADTLLDYGINTGVHAVRALAVTVPQNNLSFDIAFTRGFVWISSFAGGLRKSSDNGATWQRVLLPADSVNHISPNDTIKFSLSPVSGKLTTEGYLNHRVFSVISTNDSTLYVGTAGGINKSTDNGISWEKFNHTNQDNPISGNFVVALAYDSSENRLWAATWKAEGTTEQYGISTSSDGGENWQVYLEGEKVHNFGITNGEIKSVIAPSDDGPFRTRNDGTSWLLPPPIIDTESGISIKTNLFYAAASTGNNIWLGSNDGLARINETSGTMWGGNWKVFFASAPLASKSETYAFPNPFSPKLDVLKIKYSTGSGSAPVTIRVFDFGMNYVRTIIQDAPRGGVSHVIDKDGLVNGVMDTWDGKDDAGNVVPNGVYFYRVDVGSEKPAFGKILVIQ